MIHRFFRYVTLSYTSKTNDKKTYPCSPSFAISRAFAVEHVLVLFQCLPPIAGAAAAQVILAF